MCSRETGVSNTANEPLYASARKWSTEMQAGTSADTMYICHTQHEQKSPTETIYGSFILMFQYI